MFDISLRKRDSVSLNFLSTLSTLASSLPRARPKRPAMTTKVMDNTQSWY